MSQLAKQAVKTWPDIVNETQSQFNQIAQQHKLVLFKAESQFAIQALQKNKALAECVPYTVQNAIINVASVGLTLNPADGFAYLVPEYNKQTSQKECELRISFKGLMKVAADSGAIQWVKADVVKQNDTFTERGIGEIPEHTKDSFGDRGETVGVYCVAKLHSGEYLTDTMPISEIEQIRKCAKFDAVWKQWFDEMAKKAVIKRASKQWIKSGQHGTLNAAIEVLNETEGSDEQYMLHTPEQAEAFDKAVSENCSLTLLGLTDGLDPEVYGSLVKANKEQFREAKGMTEQNEKITNMNSEGLALFRENRESVLDHMQDGNYEAVKEIFDNFEAFGLKDKLWHSLDESDRETIRGMAE